MSVPNRSRWRRLFEGWSANLFQMILGITQQLALVPIFLHYWTGEVLAAWFTIYAAGSLVFIADSGLQSRAINQFIAFKPRIDCDGRTAHFYSGMLRIYFGIVSLLLVLWLVGMQFIFPSTVLGFQAVANFDMAFLMMGVGMSLALPSGLVAGLYRARGLYGRAAGLQSWGMLFAQFAQIIAVIATGSLLAVTIVYVVMQVLIAVYLVAVDAPRLFPFLRGHRAKHCSWPWIIGQFRSAAPFAVAGATELVLLNLPVLLVSALVSDRAAVAQWGLTRVIAGLLRSLCVQITLPLAAELGHDYVLGLKDQLRSFYARGSVFVTLQASVVVSGLLPFWPDFFALWTHGAIPYDPPLAIILLIGTSVMAPSILALGYANYSNQGDLLVRTKGLQLAVFLMLSVLLIPFAGPLGAAIAVVASDLVVQFGLLAVIIIRQTLQRPAMHVAFLAMVMVLVMSVGWVLGIIIQAWLPGSGLMRFAAECMLWLVVMILIASPLANENFRNRLIAAIPR